MNITSNLDEVTVAGYIANIAMDEVEAAVLAFETHELIDILHDLDNMVTRMEFKDGSIVTYHDYGASISKEREIEQTPMLLKIRDIVELLNKVYTT